MCNLSDGITEKSDLKHIQTIMSKLGVTISQAMDLLDIPKDKQSAYTEMLKKV